MTSLAAQIFQIGPSHECGLILTVDRGGKVVGGAGHTAQPLLERLLGELFHRRHIGLLSAYLMRIRSEKRTTRRRPSKTASRSRS